MKQLFILLLAFVVYLPSLQAFQKAPSSAKKSALGVYEGYSNKDYKGYSYNSYYLSMPDSVRLATDVFLPKKRADGETFPTIIYFVRYVRSLELKGLFKNKNKPLTGAHVPHKEIDFFTSNGYACVIVDLRGSGASFGFRKMEFSQQEVADMTFVMDWIVQQPWSDQQLATTGISYTGTTAELALSSKHPALKAAVVRSNIFDLYADINCPGGLRQTPFIEIWKKTTVALDENDFSIFGILGQMLVKGVNPVEGDKTRVLLKAAIKEHEQNFDIFSGILSIETRDDKEPSSLATSDDFSIHSRLAAIIDSKVPIYRISGWYDGGNVHSAIKGFMNVPNTERLLIGPWDHGPHNQVSPFHKGHKATFPIYVEMLRFFDFHLKKVANGIDQEAPIHYYKMGPEQFATASTWPIPNTSSETYYLSQNQTLVNDISNIKTGKIDYSCDYTVGGTNSSRWNSLTTLYKNGPTQYPNRAKINEKMLLFTSEPLSKATQVTGHPVIDLNLSIDSTDSYFFVYLEEVAPNGKVTYITEGQLRAAFRKISDKASAPYQIVGPYHSFKRADMAPMVPHQVTPISIALQPISYQIPAGHRLQISIAVADISHFDLPTTKPTNLSIHTSPEGKNQLHLPIQK